MGTREELILGALNPHDVTPDEEGGAQGIVSSFEDLFRAVSLIGDAAVLRDSLDTESQTLTTGGHTVTEGHVFFADGKTGEVRNSVDVFGT